MRKIWGKVTRAQARSQSEGVLARIPFVPGPQLKRAPEETLLENMSGKASRGHKQHETDVEDDGEQTQQRGGLSQAEFELFRHRAATPWLLTRDSLSLLGLERNCYGRLRKNLEARGLLAMIGKVGAKYRLDGLTKRGMELAESLELRIGRPRKGNIVHEAIVRYCEQQLREYFECKQLGTPRMLRAGVSATTGNRQPDLTIIPTSGHRFVMQACNQNKAAYEASVLMELSKLALLDASQADAIDFVLAVTCHKKHKAAMEKAVRDTNGGVMPPRIVLLDFDSMLEANWDNVFESIH